MTNDEVHEAVIRWLGTLWAITVIKGFQQGPVPAVPFARVHLTHWNELSRNERTVNYTELDTENSEGLKEIRATPDFEIQWSFQVVVFGSAGGNLIRKLQSAIRLLQIQEPLFPNLTVQHVSDAASLPELVDGRWEPRVHVTVAVRGRSSDGHVIDTIEDANFDIARRDP